MTDPGDPSDPKVRIPLQVTVVEGQPEIFDKRTGRSQEQAIDKKGCVNIERKNGENGEEVFEIFLVDKHHRRGRPAIINLNGSGLFDVVQECRAAWEEALESLKERFDDDHGRQKWYHPYEEA